MKTLDEIKEAYASKTIDGRDLKRLEMFIPFRELPCCGIVPKKGITKEVWDKYILPFTKENILKQLKEDVAFGFDKALDKRGISASLMYDVVKMWNWILEEGLEDFDNYPMYGLPLFKATAIKYGLPNPIGDDDGDEEEYGD